MTKPFKVAVMGAGAVGCYFGGMLARAGHDVTLIARPQHVEAIVQSGLRMQTLTFDEQVPLSASSQTRAVAHADLVLFCVKSTDTESAGQQIRDFLAPQAFVLTLQNGVDNAERLRAVLPKQVVAAAVVYVATAMVGPGHVKHNGRGELVIEPSPLSDATAQALTAAGIPTSVSGNVRGELWTKLILNCAYNAVSALVQQPYGETIKGEGIADLMHDVVQECMAVAAAEGVTLQGDVNAAVFKLASSMPAQYSSTAQDLARRRRSEIDHLNGYVLRRGQARGIATPVNRALWALVKLVEQKSSNEQAIVVSRPTFSRPA